MFQRPILPGPAFAGESHGQASLGFRPAETVRRITELCMWLNCFVLPWNQLSQGSVLPILSNKLPPSNMISVCSSFCLTSLPLVVSGRGQRSSRTCWWTPVPPAQMRGVGGWAPRGGWEKILLFQHGLRGTDGDFLPQGLPVPLRSCAPFGSPSSSTMVGVTRCLFVSSKTEYEFLFLDFLLCFWWGCGLSEKRAERQQCLCFWEQLGGVRPHKAATVREGGLRGPHGHWKALGHW